MIDLKFILEEKEKIKNAPKPSERPKTKEKTAEKTPKLILSDSEGSLEVTIGQGKREDDADHWRKELRAKHRPRAIRQKSDIEQRLFN